MEILKHANIKQISLKDYLDKKYDEPVYCNISIREHIERKDGKDFSHQDFTLNPYEYKSKVKNYLFDTDMLITGHYWDPKFPKLFYQEQINEFKNLKIIGDITCDINGAIPTTIRSTTIAKPYYSVDINSMKEIDLGNKGIAVWQLIICLRSYQMKLVKNLEKILYLKFYPISLKKMMDV